VCSSDLNDFLRVQFAGAEWDVSSLPRVIVGEKVKVTYNPYNLDVVFVVDADAEGNELLHACPRVERDDAGFALTANVIGEDYRQHARTEADRNRDAVDQAIYGVSSQDEVDAAKKAKALPFGGRIKAMKVIEDANLPSFIPKRGTELAISAVAQAPETILTHFEAARALVAQGVAMDAEKNRQVAAWYPAGVPESEVAALANRLTVRAGLKVVGG
jgi:hypothetical protein